MQEFWVNGMQPNPATTTFTILDKAGPLAVNGVPVVAGMASYINSSDTDACTEIGFVVILPQFQRSHVTSNMVETSPAGKEQRILTTHALQVGLLMHYALDLPEAGGAGSSKTAMGMLTH